MGTVSIYNLSKDTKLFLNTEDIDLKMSVKVGYEGYPLEFLASGIVTNIIDVRNGVDIVSNIYYRDGELLGLRYPNDTFVFDKEATLKQHLDKIRLAHEDFMPEYNYIGNAESLIDLDTEVFGVGDYKRFRDLFKELLGVDYHVSFYKDTVNIRTVATDPSSNDRQANEAFGGPYSYETGLLSVPTVNYFSVDFDHLLRAEFEPGLLITLRPQTLQVKFGSLIYEDSDQALDINGIFRIMEVTHTGDNRSDSWTSTVKSYGVQ